MSPPLGIWANGLALVDALRLDGLVECGHELVNQQALRGVQQRLELLVAEKASTAAESIEAIHGAVALPVDDILNDLID